MSSSSPALCSREEAHARVQADLNSRSTDISGRLERLVPKILKINRVSWHEEEPGAFDEVALNAAKDLEKLAVYQSEEVDTAKLLGYMGFWIRKLKPIKVADHPEQVVRRNINEMLSLWLITELKITEVKYLAQSGENGAIAERDRLITRIKNCFKDSELIEYITHCMRVRTFGPHHYVLMLKLLQLP